MNKKKTIFVKGMAVMLAIIFFACKEEVPVTGVKTDQTALALTVEETAVLTATIEPANATVQTVIWSVKPEGVVELNVDGNRCTVIPRRNGTVTVTASVESIKADCTIESRVYIENTAFIEAVGGQCQWTKEENGTVKLTKANREAMDSVESLTIGSPEVIDLSGIEYFTGLTDLICSGTGLTTLNVSGCANLRNLQCYSNQLKDLDVSGCPSLHFLDCSGNQLTELDVSDCTNLTWLDCFDNRLMSLDVSGCMNLASLNCYDNQLISLNVSGCMNLASLNCYNNQLTSLDVSACTSLTELICGNQTSDGVNSQILTLTLTTEQKIMWKNNWKNNNTDVIVAP